MILAALAAPARADDPAAPPAAPASAPGEAAPRGEALPAVPASAPGEAAPRGEAPPEVPAPVRAGAVAQRPVAERRFGLAVNSPLGWLIKSFAVSAYVALDRHHALRGNVAFFPNTGGLGALLSESGRIRDAGAAYVWYPRRLWDGFTFEAGVLVRERNTRRAPEFDDITKVASMTYAGRAMIGWSWLLDKRAFLSIAAGLSMGLETGTETIAPGDFGGDVTMRTTRPISRMQVDGEGYLRLGFVFGE